MAIIKRGILGTVQKSVGAVTGRLYGSTNVLCNRSQRGGIVNSQYQIEQQQRMKWLTKLLPSLHYARAQYYLIAEAKNQILWNLSQRLNQYAFDSSGLSFPENLVMSNGNLSGMVADANLMQEALNQGAFFYSPLADGKKKNDNDIVTIALFNSSTGQFDFPSETSLRSDGMLLYTFDSSWSFGQTVTLIACLYSLNGKMNSSLTFARTDSIV